MFLLKRFLKQADFMLDNHLAIVTILIVTRGDFDVDNNIAKLYYWRKIFTLDKRQERDVD